jgi:hypothetical protein
MKVMFPRFHLTSRDDFITPSRALIRSLVAGRAAGLVAHAFDPRLGRGFHRELPNASHPTGIPEGRPLTDSCSRLLVSVDTLRQ